LGVETLTVAGLAEGIELSLGTSQGISNAPAVKREAEEESGKKRGENHDLGTPGPFCLTLQNGGCLGPLQTDVEAILESARVVCRCLIGDRALISPAERSR
jgi:hypothetical protein